VMGLMELMELKNGV